MSRRYLSNYFYHLIFILQGPVTSQGLRFATNIDPVQICLYAAATQTLPSFTMTDLTSERKSSTSLEMPQSYSAPQKLFEILHTTKLQHAARSYPTFGYQAKVVSLFDNSTNVWISQVAALVQSQDGQYFWINVKTQPNSSYIWQSQPISLHILSNQTVLTFHVEKYLQRAWVACSDVLVNFTLNGEPLRPVVGVATKWPISVSQHILAFSMVSQEQGATTSQIATLLYHDTIPDTLCFAIVSLKEENIPILQSTCVKNTFQLPQVPSAIGIASSTCHNTSICDDHNGATLLLLVVNGTSERSRGLAAFCLYKDNTLTFPIWDPNFVIGIHLIAF